MQYCIPLRVIEIQGQAFLVRSGSAHTREKTRNQFSKEVRPVSEVALSYDFYGYYQDERGSVKWYLLGTPEYTEIENKLADEEAAMKDLFCKEEDFLRDENESLKSQMAAQSASQIVPVTNVTIESNNLKQLAVAVIATAISVATPLLIIILTKLN